jgi:cholest-4-en-3-one 26-monooxygenase
VPDVDWDEIDHKLTSPEFFARPDLHETFDLLRDEDPVHWTDRHDKHPFWSVTGHQDMVDVLDAPEAFSSRGGTALPAGGMPATAEERKVRGFDGDIVTMDPPVHPRFRQPFNKHFSVPSAGRMQAEIDRIIDVLLDAVAPRGECDVVEEVASQLPTRLFFPMMGIPESDWAWLRRLTTTAQLADDEEFQTEGDARETQKQSQTELFNYMRDLVRERRQRPVDDYTSVIAAMRVYGEPMADDVAGRTAMGVLVGGLETTRNALAVGLLGLMRDPEQAQLLRDDPSLAKGATEEILRWVTPSRNRLRIATEDLEFRGRQIRAGDWMVLWTLAANRDARVFRDPHQIDITRSPNDHLSFGGGNHICLGRHVARLELAAALRKFVTRFPDAEPVIEPARIASQGVNGLKRLDVRFTPAA